ncbi:Alpha/Beta hydrolase protein [Geopyxis carbonaria]|nr:Alpha/Beta hydrolase protein [Geopyxis carbonaria]
MRPLLLLPALLRVVAAAAPTVDLGYTTYAGTLLPNGVSQYVGMRFAAAPLGPLRFAAPQPPPDTGAAPVAADAFSPICIGTDESVDTPGLSEDCLFANVWTPAAPAAGYGGEKKALKPVWVFIQGGGYIVNSNPNTNGSQLAADGDVVYVNFNYRVGALGFLTSTGMKPDQLNVGFQDQRALLEWVQTHISKFGGDPSHVVIHGASAGAGSIALHMMLPDRNLFHGAIFTSPFLPQQPRVSDLSWQYTRFLTATGCRNTTSTSATSVAADLACLRALPLSTIQAANIATPFPGREGNPQFYWTPAIDGHWVPDYPYRAVQRGRIVQVPAIIGDETDEGTYFAPANMTSPAVVASFMRDQYPRLRPRDTAHMVSLYRGTPLPRGANATAVGSWWGAAVKAYGDATFTCPGLTLSDALHTTWHYHCDVVDPINVAAGIGVPHTWCLGGMLGLLNAQAGSAWGTTNRGVGRLLEGYATRFVRTLDVNGGEEGVEWKRWNKGKGDRLLFTTEGAKMETVGDLEEKRCGFWRGLGVQLQQ